MRPCSRSFAKAASSSDYKASEDGVRARSGKMASLTIANALIIPMTADHRSFNGYVRTSDGAITAVASGAPPQSVEDDASIDASGCVLMPGLINAHTHLYQVLLRAVW